MLLRYKLHETNTDVLLAADDNAALDARKEYNVLSEFASWITQLGAANPAHGGRV